MTPEAEDLQALTDNDASNDGDDNDDNETGLGGNSAKTPVSLLQVLMPFLDFENTSPIIINHVLMPCLPSPIRIFDSRYQY